MISSISQFNFCHSAVEDPSEAFVLLRDYVDCLACRSLKSFAKESLLANEKLTDDMEHETRKELKINRRQVEIMKNTMIPLK